MPNDVDYFPLIRGLPAGRQGFRGFLSDVTPPGLPLSGEGH